MEVELLRCKKPWQRERDIIWCNGGAETEALQRHGL